MVIEGSVTDNVRFVYWSIWHYFWYRKFVPVRAMKAKQKAAHIDPRIRNSGTGYEW
jgi:hypothetical protein